jgi:uncharacterized protein YjiS (DUF1127 family)
MVVLRRQKPGSTMEMTMYTTAYSYPLSRSAGEAQKDRPQLAVRLWRRFRLAMIRRAAARSLDELSDATLKDIGLPRSEIDWHANAVAERRVQSRG